MPQPGGLATAGGEGYSNPTGRYPPLLEASYRQRTEQGAMVQWQYELVNGNRYRKGSRSLQQLARVGLTLGGKTLPESKAQTRYSEQETAQLLLLRQFSYDTRAK